PHRRPHRRRQASNRPRNRRRSDAGPAAAGLTAAPMRLQPALAARPLRAPVLWGVVVGAIQAASPLAFWWLDAATVYALGLAVIAAIYIGFAVADGRWKVFAVESGVATMFVVIAAAAITGTSWLLVVGFVGHGLKDVW